MSTHISPPPCVPGRAYHRWSPKVNVALPAGKVGSTTFYNCLHCGTEKRYTVSVEPTETGRYYTVSYHPPR